MAGAGDEREPIQGMRRRGLIAGAAVLAAGLIAEKSVQPVAAGNGDGQNFTLGQVNTATSTTALNTSIGTNGYYAFRVTGNAVAIEGAINKGSTIPSSAAVSGFNGGTGTSIAGVIGQADLGIGVKGFSGGADDTVAIQGNINNTSSAKRTLAVQGHNFSSGFESTGVQGLIDSRSLGTIGVEGRNNSPGPNPNGANSGSIGVLGTIANDPGQGNEFSDNSVGVSGLNLSTRPGTFGVTGVSYGANGAGILGVNNSSGVGLQGQSAAGHGLTGVSSATDGHAGIFAYAMGARAVAISSGTDGSPGAKAAIFYGDVTITGSLAVGGGKNASVRHPDGVNRLLYCVESPESWFEDFGEAKLNGGRAVVTLDADFVAVSAVENYHVFLTEYDQHNDLYVTNRTSRGFEVRAKSGTPGGTFAYRIVAKRKDIEGKRLARHEMPRSFEKPLIHDAPIPKKHEADARAALARVAAIIAAPGTRR